MGNRLTHNHSGFVVFTEAAQSANHRSQARDASLWWVYSVEHEYSSGNGCFDYTGTDSNVVSQQVCHRDADGTADKVGTAVSHRQRNALARCHPSSRCGDAPGCGLDERHVMD